MRSKKTFRELIALLVIAATTLFVTGVPAVAQTETVLHNFNNIGGDGNTPSASLTFDASGNLYGTTNSGGAFGYGTVFELLPEAGGGWTEKILHSFNNDGADGVAPRATLIFDGIGNLYGMTSFGGRGACNNAGIVGCGAVFELKPQADGRWTEKVLRSFDVDLSLLYAGLIADASGNLYGTTYEGGVFGYGTVFELSPNVGGGWTEKVLHNFNLGDGLNPAARLTFDAVGNLYGTTRYGGSEVCFNGISPGCGTAFELKPNADGNWSENLLYSFRSFSLSLNPPAPFPSALTFDGAGNLYGTTQGGISVFKLSPRADGAWRKTDLVNLNDLIDGSGPEAGVIFDGAGNLYVTTGFGGPSGHGTALKLTPATGRAWTPTVLHSFGIEPDGSEPAAALIIDANGNLYGTTGIGGTHGGGIVFEITP
jgi:uncharacterized repeat protein (TIGR03803 family)